jgi:WD40 repeat protein
MTYNAFISYSHVDGTLAAALQSALDSFAKPWYKLRALHIFRDQTNLAVNPALWSSIRKALDQSSFFILLASPEGAASPWVDKEAAYWIGQKGLSRVLLVLTGGTLQWDSASACFISANTNSLPPSLLLAFPEEPLFLDLRWVRDGAVRLRLSEPRFHEAVLQLAATLHNRPKDELDGADIRARRQTRLLAASGLIAILLTGLFAARQSRRSHEESVQSLAVSLAAKSARLLTDHPERAREAALLAIESNRLDSSFEGNQALQAAVSLLPANAQFYAPEDASPDKRVRDMTFSPDGAILAVARDDGSTQLIDVEKRKPIGYFEPDDQPAAHIELSGNQQGGATDDNSAVSVAFNSDGSELAVGARNGAAHVWSVPTGRELLRISHGSSVSQLAFRPKSNQLVTAFDDGRLSVFDVADAAIVRDFNCPGRMVSTSFSPGGGLLAALSSEGEVCLFDPVRGKLLRKLIGGEAGFNMAFSHSGVRLAIASGDFAFVWDATSGRRLLKATHAAGSETLTPQQWIYSAAIGSDGKLLAYAARGDSSAHVWNVETGRQILELKHNSAVAAVSFNADGTKVGTGSYDGTARVWELPSGRELGRVTLAGGAEVVVFSPDGKRFASGGVDGSASVFEPRRADRPASFFLPNRVSSVAFSPDGRRVAIATTSVHSWPLVEIADIDGKVLSDIEFHGAPVIDKLFFVDANEVIAQSSENLFLLAVDHSAVTPFRDVPKSFRIDPSGKVLASQQGAATGLYALPGLRQTAFLDGPASAQLRAVGIESRLLAFESREPPSELAIDIWSVSNKARVVRIPVRGELTSVAFNPPGTVLFTAEGENLQAWNLPSGKQRFSLKAEDDIDQIIFDPSSTSLATLTNGHLTVWDGANGARLAQPPDMGYLRAAAFSPDGRFLLAGYEERVAALWLWRSGDLRDQACARLQQNLSHEEWERWFSKQPYRPICSNLAVPK